MTIDPVASSIELYSKFLENAYAQAGQAQRSTARNGDTSTSSTQATLNYALSVTVNSRQERTARSLPAETAIVEQNATSTLAAPVTRQQALLEQQSRNPEFLEAVTLQLESTQPRRNPLGSVAARAYASGSRRPGAGELVGSTLRAVA